MTEFVPPLAELVESASSVSTGEVFVFAELALAPDPSADTLPGAGSPESADVVAYQPMEVTVSEPVAPVDSAVLPAGGPEGSLGLVAGLPAALPSSLPPTALGPQGVGINRTASVPEVEGVGPWWGIPDGTGVEKWIAIPGRGPRVGPSPYRIVNPEAIPSRRLPPWTQVGRRDGDEEEETRHQVQRGETLVHIGRRHGREAWAIAEENQISDPDRIEAGQWLRIPGSAVVDALRTERRAEPEIEPERPEVPSRRTPAQIGPAPVARRSEETRHQVQRGETLVHIGRRHGREASAIAKENQISDPERIEVGRWLRIPEPAVAEELRTHRTTEPKIAPERPAPTSQKTPPQIVPAPLARSGETLHEVQPGETLFLIGRLHGTPAEVIAETNLLENPDRIHPGQWLRIPSVSEPPSPQAQPDPVVAPLVVVAPVPAETRRQGAGGDREERWNRRPEDSSSADQPAPLVQRSEERSGSGYASGPRASAAQTEPAPTVRSWEERSGSGYASGPKASVAQTEPAPSVRSWVQAPVVARADPDVTSRLRPVLAPVTLPVPEPVQVLQGSTGTEAFCQVRYTVQPSDTVASIARAHGIHESDVLGWSEEPVIYPGQVLFIPVRYWIAGARSAE